MEARRALPGLTAVAATVLATLAVHPAAAVSPRPDPGRSAGVAAPTVIGSTGDPATSSYNDCVSLSAVQGSVAAGTPTYTVPSPGVITSFSHYAATGTGASTHMRALFLRPTGATDQYAVTGYSALVAVTPGVLNTFATRIPVVAGDQLGLRVKNSDTFSNTNRCLFGTSDPADSFHWAPDTEDSLTTVALATTASQYRLNISAVIEPDADGDHYGDLTQDQCPTSAASHDACPDTTAPETTITKGPPKKTRKHRAKISFATTEPGGTFECGLDGKRFKPCTSPALQRVSVGKHVFRVRSTDQAGNLDATPAKATWRVRPAAVVRPSA